LRVVSETGEFPAAEARSDAAGRVRVGVAAGAAYRLEVGALGFQSVERHDIRGGGDPLRTALTRSDR
jgi:hypothetical protein